MAPKPELVRLAVAPAAQAPRRGAPAAVVIDRAGNIPGRGAYLCRAEPRLVAVKQCSAASGSGGPRAECLALAMRRKAMPRAFRRAVEFVESVSR